LTVQPSVPRRQRGDRIVIEVPSINRGYEAYGKLCELWNAVEGTSATSIVFDFSRCTFLSQTAVAFLGALARWIETCSGEARFNWRSLSLRVLTNLRQNGFAHAFGQAYGPWAGNSVGYREDRRDDELELIGYLKTKWLVDDWVHLSDDLRNYVAGTVWEIYANAFEHASSAIGVYTCGQHYPRALRLDLSVIDFGVGIPANVREYIGKPDFSPADAMEWALEKGNTTNPKGLGRGLGLDFLREFILLNKGSLEIYSHAGFLGIGTDGTSPQAGGPFFGSISGKVFPGTVVVLTLRCDDIRYSFGSEQTKKPLF